MYLVVFISDDGEVVRDKLCSSLQRVLMAINEWFAETDGAGEARVTYRG